MGASLILARRTCISPCSSNSQFVKFPILIIVASIPQVFRVVPFVGKSDGDPILAATPDLLDQAIVQFPLPLADQKRMNRLSEPEKLGTITSTTIRSVGKYN